MTKKRWEEIKEQIDRSIFVPVELAEELMKLVEDLTEGKEIIFDED